WASASRLYSPSRESRRSLLLLCAKKSSTSRRISFLVLFICASASDWASFSVRRLSSSAWRSVRILSSSAILAASCSSRAVPGRLEAGRELLEEVEVEEEDGVRAVERLELSAAALV